MMNDKFFDVKKEKQDRIINASLKMFALNGYRHASTDDTPDIPGAPRRRGSGRYAPQRGGRPDARSRGRRPGPQKSCGALLRSALRGQVCSCRA